jgi:hypothetical protein
MSMSLPRETLLKFPNRVFVETGTNMGDGVALALDCGFQRVISIELSAHYYEAASRRFANDPRVTLIGGDSALELGPAIRDIDEPMTFWLDGHAVPGLPNTAPGLCPIFWELAGIGQHHIKTHTILVDDVRCFGTDVLNNITLDEVQKAIRVINPAYEFVFVGDVLAAVARAL